MVSQLMFATEDRCVLYLVAVVEKVLALSAPSANAKVASQPLKAAARHARNLEADGCDVTGGSAIAEELCSP